MDDETLEASVAEAVLKDGARSVRSDTLLLVTHFGKWVRTAAKAISKKPETETTHPQRKQYRKPTPPASP